MLDTKARYTVSGWSDGIAWYTLGYAPCLDRDDEPTGEVDTSKAVMVMVGDDREFECSVSDLTVVKDYCPECGQVGCHAYC